MPSRWVWGGLSLQEDSVLTIAEGPRLVGQERAGRPPLLQVVAGSRVASEPSHPNPLDLDLTCAASRLEDDGAGENACGSPRRHVGSQDVAADISSGESGHSSLHLHLLELVFGLGKLNKCRVLLREEVSRLQEEVHLLRQMKEMLAKDLEESQGGKSSEVLSATELRVQLAQKEQELARAKEALQAMKADRKRLKGEKTDLVSQMQQLYATLESREEQLRDFIRNYEQHRKESEDAVKALAKEKDLLEREKWELRRQAKEATDHATALRSQLDLKDNRMKELEAELAMAKQSLATLTKDVPKRHSLAMPGETVLNGNQEWVVQADLPLTAAIRQSQQTLYHSHPPHPADRQAKGAALLQQSSVSDSPSQDLQERHKYSSQVSALGNVCTHSTAQDTAPDPLLSCHRPPGSILRSSCKKLPCVTAVRVSPCHSRQPSVISDASAAEGDRSSTPSDINSPRHRTHSLCNGDSPGPVQKNLHNPIVQSLEDLEDQKRKKKKEKMGFGSISRVFARGKQRKSLDPGLFDGTAPDYYIEEDADW
ncbi:Kazrin [Tupaia chinensis]|uniref:Kazrin n=1 Tax=Tupaia chinensis TaxID=246437 RepID=L9L084_TUPCH|nr:Kazrin [Tupaia chinensis]